MRRRKCLVVGLVGYVLLGLVAGDAWAGDGCKKQNAKISNISESVVDPVLCAPYETCQFFDVRGTLNGSGGWYRNEDWVTLVAGDTVVLWAEMRIETRKGDLILQERCLLYLATMRATCTSSVEDGTGVFADTIGWLAHAPTSRSGPFPDTTQVVSGKICPEIDD